MPTKIMFILGTRPEAIKMAPLIRGAQSDERFRTIVCSTGQHREMTGQVFESFGLKPDRDWDIMKPGQTLQQTTAAVLKKTREAIQELRPDWVIVQGDTTSAMAASLSAFYERVSVAHVEAGLRTGDISSPFPEELNRRITGLIANFHFAPDRTFSTESIERRCPADRVAVTGNTGIDALLLMSDRLKAPGPLGDASTRMFAPLNSTKKMILATLHRRESFGESMRQTLRGLVDLSERNDVELVLPVHPNPEVRRLVREILPNLTIHKTLVRDHDEQSIFLVDPFDYPTFVGAMSRSHMLLTDSGGVQEEAPGLGKPVLVMRDNTERPEAIDTGTSRLVGTDRATIFREGSRLLDDVVEHGRMSSAINPFGDGLATGRILEQLARGPVPFELQ